MHDGVATAGRRPIAAPQACDRGRHHHVGACDGAERNRERRVVEAVVHLGRGGDDQIVVRRVLHDRVQGGLDHADDAGEVAGGVLDVNEEGVAQLAAAGLIGRFGREVLVIRHAVAVLVVHADAEAGAHGAR